MHPKRATGMYVALRSVEEVKRSTVQGSTLTLGIPALPFILPSFDTWSFSIIAAFSLVQLMGLFHYLNPFAASFPAIPGGAGVHAVGYLSVHHPPRYPFELAEPTSQASGLPVLRVEEIGWSVFYPSAEDSRKRDSGVRWLVG
jgi:hypothetical protein